MNTLAGKEAQFAAEVGGRHWAAAVQLETQS
jgi:hypothetical protein